MSDLPQLQSEKSALEAERDRIVAAIHELRARARQKSLEASSTRVPLAQSEIEFWKTGIAAHQTELMAVQAKLGEVGKQLRKGKADHGVQRQRQPIRSLAQLPREVAVKEALGGAQPNGVDPLIIIDGAVPGLAGIQAPDDLKKGHVLFLQFFHQLVVENIDPRLVEVFEKDAHGLVNDYRRMHKEPS